MTTDVVGQCAQVYQMLEDEESKEIYLNRLNWLISGNKKYLKNISERYLSKNNIVNIFDSRMARAAGKTVSDLRELLPRNRKIVLYGAGTLAKQVLTDWIDDERFIGFCSKTKEKQKSGYLGYPVMKPEELLSRKDLSVVISTTRACDEIAQILANGGYPKEQIWKLQDYMGSYQFDVGQYFSPDFISFDEDEIFIDAGCLDLGTSLNLKRYCPHIKKIYAFEPDPDSYSYCMKEKERCHFDEVSLYPYGTWSERTNLHFSILPCGSSCVSDRGDCVVPVVPIDEIVDPDDKVTMIKMDIEGSELESLKGAKRIIQSHKPKLAICIYHKPEDMTAIPLYIKELVPEYHLYIRHYTDIWTETVLYAII